MRLRKISEVELFLDTVNACNGDVWLTSPYGDKYNLKSLLSQYVAIGALIGEKGDELELWCGNKSDESKFLHLLKNHPEIQH